MFTKYFILFLVIFLIPLCAQEVKDVDGWYLRPVSDSEGMETVVSPTLFISLKITPRSSELNTLFQTVGLQRSPLADSPSQNLRSLWHDIARLHQILGPAQLQEVYGWQNVLSAPPPSDSQSACWSHLDKLGTNATEALARIDSELARLFAVIGVQR